jgi:N-carbamoylputrescine amidase
MTDETVDQMYPGERIPGRESVVKVAAIQMHPRVGDKRHNQDESRRLIGLAAEQGVQLAVLPELSSSGYIFNSRAEVAALAEPVPSGSTCELWMALAREHNMYIAAGICEVEAGRFYNTAVLVGPEGCVGKYRKTHIWDEEKLFFEPGNLGYPIFHLPFGRVGLMVCYDGWHPEVPRILALQGADIICDPTCWVLVPGIVTAENPVSAYVHMAHAHVNNIFMICADRCGVERGCTFLGNSCIVGPSGFIAGPASMDRTEIKAAEVNLAQARYKHWTALADPFADRRTDLYDSLLGYRPRAFETRDQHVAAGASPNGYGAESDVRQPVAAGIQRTDDPM